MMMVWAEDDIQGGLIVAQMAADESFLVPFIISWKDQHPDTLWGITDLRDGMFISYKTKDLLAQSLTAGGYILAYKFIGYHSTVNRFENRSALPVVSITNVRNESNY